MSLRSRAELLFLIGILLGGCSGTNVPPAETSRQSQMLTSGPDWPMYRRDDTGDSYVPVTLTTSQAQAFSSAWTYPGTGSIEDSNGIVVNGVLYQVYYSNKLRALNAGTGAVIWTASMNAPSPTPCAPGFHGGAVAAPAVEGSAVYVPGGDGNLYAFDIATGNQLWMTPIADNGNNEFLWSSAFPLDGRIYVGVATFGGEDTCGPAAGRLVAVTESTGAVYGTWWADSQHRQGGTIWSQPTYDPVSGRILVNTGNVGKGINATDEPYSQAVVAIDPDTMLAVDSYQVVATDANTDYDFGASPALVDTPMGQHLIIAVNKDGYAYALNRNNLAGGIVWSYQICQPGSSPETGTGTLVSPTVANGRVFVGGGATTDGFSGIVAALDADTGQQLWVFHPDGFILAGLSSAGDVVFAPATGGSKGHIYVLAQADGTVEYHLDDSSSSFISQPTFAEGLLFAGDETGNIFALQPGPPTMTIGPVTGLMATGGANQVALSWTNPTGATYAATRVIQSKTGYASGPTPSGDQTIVFDTSGTGTTVTGLTAGTPYFYTAWARDTSGNYSATSATATATTTGSPPPPPIGPITNLVANGGTGQVGLTWTNPTGAYASTEIIQSKTGYASSPTPSGDQTIVFNASGTATTVTGLAAGTQYFYTAWARDTSGHFSATAATATTTTAGGGGSPVTFSDPFSECTSTTNLGPNWTIENGTWYCKSGKARGESASSLALANTARMTDTDETVRIQLSSPTLSEGGLALRVSGTSYYAARGVATGHVQLLRVNGGTITVLDDVAQTVSPEPASHQLRLRAMGAGPVQLDVWLDGVNVISMQDSSAQLLTIGLAGLYNGANARDQFDTYSLTATTGTTTPPIGPITGFTALGGSGQIALSWTNPTGAYASTEIIQSKTGYASSPTPSGDQTIVFNASGTSTTVTGLTAGTPYFYTAWARDTSGNFSATSATATATTTGSPPPPPIGPVTGFTAMGGTGQVALSWTNPTGATYASTEIIQSETGYASSPTPSGDQTIVFNAAGTSTTVTGLAAGTMYFYTAWARDTSGNFSTTSATASAMTAGSGTPVSFSDTFSECTSTTNIGPNWTVVNGRWYCAGSKARGESAASQALANTAAMSNTNVTVRVQFADPTLGSGGVVARSSGGNYYAARAETAGHVQIIKVNGATVTVLGDFARSISPEPASYRLTLVVSGTGPVQLTASFDGTQVLSVQDTSAQPLTSGQAGLYNGSNSRGMYASFSVTGD